MAHHARVAPDSTYAPPLDVVYYYRRRRVLVRDGEVLAALAATGGNPNQLDHMTYADAWAYGLALIRAGDLASGLPIAECEALRDGGLG